MPLVILPRHATSACAKWSKNLQIVSYSYSLSFLPIFQLRFTLGSSSALFPWKPVNQPFFQDSNRGPPTSQSQASSNASMHGCSMPTLNHTYSHSFFFDNDHKSRSLSRRLSHLWDREWGHRLINILSWQLLIAATVPIEQKRCWKDSLLHYDGNIIRAILP